MTTLSPFIFQDWNWDADTKRLDCHYRVDEYQFTESFIFDLLVNDQWSEAAFKQACTGLWLMAGISYFKAFHDRPIQVENHSITTQQAEFFEHVYKFGLGEFAFENQIPLVTPTFPAEATSQESVSLNLNPEVIIPLGGGKDSLTTIELIQKTGLPFSTWTVGAYPGLQKSLDIIESDNPGSKHLTVQRIIDRQIVTLNQNGAPNGHVPISAIWAFISVCTALLSGHKYIAFSNENSANEGTTIYHGYSINHQFSKSLEFETAFQDYVHTNISPDLEYFSALRPLEELFIAEIFANTAWKKHQKHFSSCNRNFHLDGQTQEFFWCGQCPKCAFVFSILAPFVPKEELLNLFGNNLFTSGELKADFEALLGISEHKPFECVGTIDEVRMALSMVTDKFPESAKLLGSLKPRNGYNYKALAPHAIPDEVWAKLANIIKNYV